MALEMRVASRGWLCRGASLVVDVYAVVCVGEEVSRSQCQSYVHDAEEGEGVGLPPDEGWYRKYELPHLCRAGSIRVRRECTSLHV